MKIKPIKTIYDYNQAQKYLESIFHNELTEEEANDVAVLEVLIENFERQGKPSKENLEVEPLIDYVFDLVTNASQYEEKGLLERGLKLGEEYGELSAEILKLAGYKRSKETRKLVTSYWKELLKSTAPALLKSENCTPNEVDSMVADLDQMEKDENAIFFYQFVQAKATL